MTGLDLVTPIGADADAFWKAALAGVSGVKRIAHFDPEGLPTQIAAALDDRALVEEFRLEAGLDPPEPRGVVVGVRTARGAVAGAGVRPVLASPRAGVFVGTSGERHDLRELGDIAYVSRPPGGRATPAGFLNELGRRAAPRAFYRTWPQYLASRLAGHFRIEGPTATIQTACTSSAQAIGEAYRAIRRGAIDVALAGGAECIVSPIEVQLFCLLGVMSRQNATPETASRPFDARRDGFVIAEGAGVLVLEELEHARRRGARVYAEVVGYGANCDAYHMTQPAPEGEGAAQCMALALADAGVRPDEVGYVNAHGTGTPYNDAAETRAIHKVFGPHATRVAVSSTKSMTGHLLGAAGTVEAAYTVLALMRGLVPPTINLDEPDPACDLDYVPHEARRLRVDAALSNSFGFGGTNVSLVFRRAD